MLRACVSAARVKTGDPTVLQSPEVLRLATMEGAEALGLGAEIGSIEPGKRADLQMLDYRRFGLTPNLDPVRNLVYHAHSKDVELVMVGRQRPRRGLRAEDGGRGPAHRRCRCGGGGGVGPLRREIRRLHGTLMRCTEAAR